MRMPLLHYFVVVGSSLERRMNERGDKQPEENRRDHQREGENHRDPSAMPDVTNNPPQRRRVKRLRIAKLGCRAWEAIL